MKKNKLKRICIISTLALLHIAAGLRADVLPKNKSLLHSTTVYFEENKLKNANLYQLKVYSDSAHLKKDSSFILINSEYPSFSCQALSWGKSYYWCINALSAKGKLMQPGNVHTFSIMPEVSSPYFDSIRIDVRINKPNLHANGYLVIDYLKAIYDRNSNLIWRLPEIDNIVNQSSEIRDLKFTKENTITFLSDSRPLEIDLQGNVVWQLPSPFVFMGDTLTFHHDYKKTNHDTYLMLANKVVLRKTTDVDAETFKKSERAFIEKNGELYTHTEVAIIVEINLKGEVVWWWDSNTYLEDSDLNHKKRPDGLPQLQTHANAIGLNDENTKVFIGFRDISRILVINKASKAVELSFGEKYPSGEAKWGNSLFKQQHDAKSTTRNSILIFNNNGPKGNFGISSIIELSVDPLKSANPVIWSFTLDFDSLTKGRSGSGGNVNELPNGNILLCAGQLNRIFEVTKNKEVVWDAFLYALHKSDGKWHTMPQYRASWTPKVVFNQLYTDLKLKQKSGKKSMTFDLEVFDPLLPNDTYEITAFESHSKKPIKFEYTSKSCIRGTCISAKIEPETYEEVSIRIRSKSSGTIVKTLILSRKI